MTVFAYSLPPTLTQLQQFLSQTHAKPLQLIIALPDKVCPPWQTEMPKNKAEQKLLTALNEACRCLQFNAANFIADFQNNVDLWLMPPQQMCHLHDYFDDTPIHYLDIKTPQSQKQTCKPWFSLPSGSPPENVLIIGAGIAGASTAYELAKRGVYVTLLEAKPYPARAASGNHQGLLYAKISAHPTLQTELLLSGYGYTHRLLQKKLPENQAWASKGILHLAFDEKENQRQQQLNQQHWHHHLYHHVTAQQASHIAGVQLQQNAQFWPQGAWLNPASLIQKLLQHPLITLHTDTPITQIQHDGKQWNARSHTQTFSGSHIIFCCGSESQSTQIINQLPFRMIRGQTTLARATTHSQKLQVPLSGASYISPVWQGVHCFGASFIINDATQEWRSEEDLQNQKELSQLAPELFSSFKSEHFQKGHTAVRCDSYDHLPVVGPLGDAKKMHEIYQKLRADKNYPINTPCPYLPNAYINTAHGSRGLATAPLCAAELAAQICGTGRVLSTALRHALAPNRLIIRQLTHPKAA